MFYVVEFITSIGIREEAGMELGYKKTLIANIVLFAVSIVIALMLYPYFSQFPKIIIMIGMLFVPLGLYLYENFEEKKRPKNLVISGVMQGNQAKIRGYIYNNTPITRTPIDIKPTAYDLLNNWLQFVFDMTTLRHKGNHRYTFENTYKIRFLTMVLLGLVAALYYSSLLDRALLTVNLTDAFWVELAKILICAWIAVYSLKIWYFTPSSVSFDLSEGVFQMKGQKTQLLYAQELQLSSVFMSAKGFSQQRKKSYTLYQITIAQQDGSRQNLATYVSKKSAEKDAQTLAKILTLPLWNGVL